jgi:Raf kinase inhibitor-like YbhB/YbcL family protein
MSIATGAAMMGGVGYRWRALWVAAMAAFLFASCSSAPAASDQAEELGEQPVEVVIAVSSPEFAEGAPIPVEFSCDGEELSPPLSWTGVPGRAVELAVVVDDPDAGGGTYVHWILFGLDSSLGGVEAGVVPTGGRQANNSAGDAAYKGPCPPGDDGPHGYRFTVYALDEEIADEDGAAAGDVLDAVREAAIAKGTLTGTFDR